MNYSKIPSVTKLLEATSAGLSTLDRSTLKFFINLVLRKIRKNEIENIAQTFSEEDLELKSLAKTIQDLILRELPTNKEVINGTGIILHTGFGRAPLSDKAKKSLETASGYNLVQAARQDGARTIREELIEDILFELTGAEASTVLNNNAAATFLMLKTLAYGKEVIISRGQLVEIGGSYRMPDIIQESGCIMREVGTTNKTHLFDYEKALNHQTGAILFVHQSNYKIEGFSSHPSILELCKFGKENNVPVLADLGSGALIDLEKFNLPHETTVKEVIKAGITACSYSGDKLIGGPQAGIISGDKQTISKIRANPFSRMCRVCKLTLRALEATLLDFLDEENLKSNIPIYKMLNVSVKELEERGTKIKNALNVSDLKIIDSKAFLGGGSIPQSEILSKALKFSFRNQEAANSFSRKLRFNSPAVFARLSNSEYIIDLRTIDNQYDQKLIEILKASL